MSRIESLSNVAGPEPDGPDDFATKDYVDGLVDLPQVAYRRSATVSVANNSHQLLTWTTRDYAYGTWETASTSTVTIPENGLYRIYVAGQLAKSATVDGYMQFTVTKNESSVSVDAIFATGQSFAGTMGAEALAQGWSAPMEMESGDVLRVFCYQLTGASRDLSVRGDVPVFAVERVR